MNNFDWAFTTTPTPTTAPTPNPTMQQLLVTLGCEHIGERAEGADYHYSGSTQPGQHRSATINRNGRLLIWSETLAERLGLQSYGDATPTPTYDTTTVRFAIDHRREPTPTEWAQGNQPTRLTTPHHHKTDHTTLPPGWTMLNGDRGLALYHDGRLYARSAPDPHRQTLTTQKIRELQQQTDSDWWQVGDPPPPETETIDAGLTVATDAITLLAGPRKSGKTWTALRIGGQVAQHRGGIAVYITGESIHHIRRSRSHLLPTGSPIIKWGAVTTLTTRISQPIGAIIIDPYRSAAAHLDLDTNQETAIEILTNHIHNTIGDSPIILTQHLRKSRTGDLDDIRGSGALADAAGIIWMGRPVPNQWATRWTPTTRYGPPLPTRHIDHQTGEWRDTTAGENRATNITDAATVLWATSGPATVKEIGKQADTQISRDILDRMVNRGELAHHPPTSGSRWKRYGPPGTEPDQPEN